MLIMIMLLHDVVRASNDSIVQTPSAFPTEYSQKVSGLGELKSF